MAQHDGGVERVLQLGVFADGFGHQATGVEQHGELLAFLHLFVPADRRAAPRGRFPIDIARIFAGDVRAQTFEVGAGGLEWPRLAHDFLATVDLRQQLVLIGAARIGIHLGDVRDCDRELFLDQTAFALGAQDHIAEAVRAAAERAHGVAQARFAARRNDDGGQVIFRFERIGQLVTHDDVQRPRREIAQYQLDRMLDIESEARR